MITEEYIYAHKIKPSSRGCYSVCPACSGHNLWYTEDNGSYYCFNCGFKGNTGKAKVTESRTYFVNIQQIQELYGALAELYHKNLSCEHRTYLHNRGIDDVVIREFQLGTCVDSSTYYTMLLAEAAGIVYPDSHYPVLRGRITIPYINGVVTDIRGRGFVEPKYKSLLYSSEQRGAVFGFNQQKALEAATEYVILTEGEFKAIAAHTAGFPAIALPGMTSWKSGIQIPAHITPIVVFDSSLTADVSVRQAIRRVITHLHNPYITKLPLLGNSKMDIDQLLLRPDGYRVFKRLIEGALPAAKFFKLQSF